ncbi:MAG: hypothetical protein KC910_35060 [Candidatus Eremiobacteraeota bacterium]|nr:hypothetical protein [Candidatus Eremiobacteraeota bacterium]
MPIYDFKTLSPHDFEALCRDLLSKELGFELEIFAPGPDEGREAPAPDQPQPPATLKDADLGWATIRRFGYSERTDAENRSHHVKIKLRPRTTARHQYRTL